MDSKSKFIIPLIIGALFTSLYFLSFSNNSNDEASPIISVGHIATIDGENISLKKNFSDPSIVQIGLPYKISDKNIIETGKTTTSQINLSNDWTIELEQNTSVQINKWALNNLPGGTIILNFHKGSYKVVKKGDVENLIILSGGRQYKIGEEFGDRKAMASLVLEKALQENSFSRQPEKSIKKTKKFSSSVTNKAEIETIENSIFKKKFLFEKCLANRIRENRKVSGRIMVGFNIIANGDLSEVKIIENETSDNKIENCIVNAFSRIKINNYEGKKAFFAFPLDFK